MNTLLPLRIENRTLIIRGLRVMIDTDLYGVPNQTAQGASQTERPALSS